MKDLLDKLSSYNIFNYLLPGILFAALGDRLISSPLLFDDIVIGVFVYYFYGLVLSRIGSLLLEPFFKWVRILHFAPYAEFVKASKNDQKIELLSEINNMYRTLSSLFLCLLLLRLFESIGKAYPVLSHYSLTFAIFVLMILFILSYRKQTGFIKSRVAHTIQSKSTIEGKNTGNVQ